MGRKETEGLMPEFADANTVVTADTAVDLTTIAPVEQALPAVEPKRSLRDDLAAAVEAHKQSQARDDKTGRFASSAPSPTADVKPGQPAAGDASPITPAPAAAPPQPLAADRPANMPKAWGADRAAIWSTLPPEAVAYISEREAQMEAFHAKHAGLSRWQEAATENGTSLPEVLDRVYQVESAMASDPSSGLIAACQMVGMDAPGAVAAMQGALRKLGVAGPAPTADDGTGQPQPQAPAADPRVEVLTQRLSSIERTFQDQATAKANEQVQAFFADAKNEFAKELQNEIAAELRAMRAMGQQPDLPKAYERALWTRPDVREKLVAKQIAQKTEEAAKLKAQELTKARSASRSVAGSPPVAEGRSSADRPSKLRDEIAAQVRSVNGRV
jgi:hypothetical protein